MIKVSVIVPVYKVPLEYLRECLDSLLAQTMQECEFIVVSDGAPDAECSVCEEYAAKDSRFKFFRREHAGVSATRNFGIEQAQGEYITFVDSDDTIESKNLEETCSYALENNSEMVLWDAIFFGNHNGHTCFATGNISKLSKDTIDIVKQNILSASNEKYSCVSMVSCKLYRKALLERHNIRYATDLMLCEDRLFNFLCFSKSTGISYISRPFYHYRVYSSSTSQKFIPNAFFEYTKFLSKIEPSTTTNFASDCSNMIVFSFFKSWQTCYLHPQNLKSFSSSVKELRNIATSHYFRKALKHAHFKNFSKLLIFESLCLRFNIRLLMYLHIIKSFVQRTPFKHQISL